VGHITHIYDDGTCRVRNDISGEDWFGRVVVMSGGMLCFDTVDERRVTVTSGPIVEDTDDQPRSRDRRGPRSRRTSESSPQHEHEADPVHAAPE